MSPGERTLDVERLLAQSDWARGLALRLVGDAQLADDVVQDAWVAALERPPEGARLREWFARVVRNLALRRRSREAARVGVERSAAPRRPSAGPDEALARLELQRSLAEHVLALAEPCRTALVLRHVEGLSAREIAARTGCSEEAARQRVARGLARLRERFDAQSGGDRSAWCGAFAALWDAARDSQAAAATAGLGAIGGTLVGAKTTLAVTAVGLTLGGIVWVARDRAGAGETARPQARAVAPAAEGAGASERAPDATPEPEARTREAIEAPLAAQAAGLELRGRAVDDLGVALAGVEVLVLPEQGDDPLGSTTSLETGAFSLAAGRFAAPADGTWRLRAQREGHAAVEVERPGPDLGEFVLARNSRVRGVVRTPDGSPASPPGRVELSVSPAQGEPEWSSFEFDSQGRFESSLAPGRLVEARCKARGFAPGQVRPDLELAPGSSHALELVLERGEIVRGVVLDAATSQPVPFAEVWSEAWVYDAGSIEPSTVADADGRFELHGVRATTVSNDQGATAVAWVSVTARAPGYLGRPFEPTLLRRDDGGELGQVVIRIGRADAAVAGRVTWPDGSAAVGVPIYSVDDGMNLKFTQSDLEGRFELAGLAPGPLAICARTSPEFPDRPVGRADAHLELEAGARATRDLVLALPSERIAGRVLDEHGAGLPGVELEAGEHFHTGKLTMGVGSHRATTDAQGRYTFANLSPGRYQIEIVAAERRERAARPARHSIELLAGESREDADFELVQAVVCAGWVDVGDADAAAFEVARVRADDGEELERRELASDGRFRFEGCWPEACALVLRREGRELARIGVGSAGGQGLVLAAPR